MTNLPGAFLRWFGPMVAGCCAVIGLCGFVVVTTGQNRADAARVAESTAWAPTSPTSRTGSRATSPPTVAPPSVEAILIKAGCPRATVTTEVPGVANCYLKSGVLVMADTYTSTAARDAGVTSTLNAGEATLPPQVLVGPTWTVDVSCPDDGFTARATLITREHAALAAVARRIGGTIRTA